MRTARTTSVQLRLSGQYQHPCGINLDTSEMEFYGTEGDFSRGDESEPRSIYIAPAVESRLRLILDEQINSNLYTENFGIEAYRVAVEIIFGHT